MRLILLASALLLVACSAPSSRPVPATPTPAPAPTGTPDARATDTVVRAQATALAAALSMQPRSGAPTSVPAAAPMPTATAMPMVDAPTFPYVSAVARNELPAKVLYRVADVRKYKIYWELKVQAPLARDAARAMRVVADVADEVLSQPAGPRVVELGVYSQDPIAAARDPFTADPDLAEAFASRDGRGLTGDGTWPGLLLYTFTTPFGDHPFRDEGKLGAE